MTESDLRVKLAELASLISEIRHEADRGPAKALLDQIIKGIDESPKKQTSPEMSTMGSWAMRVSAADWYSLNNDEQLRIVRSMGACIVSQDETKGN